MTEGEWLAGTDPAPILRFLAGEASERKLRLFACACCRRAWHLLTDERSRKVVEVAERHAEGRGTDEELDSAGDAAADAANAAIVSRQVTDAVTSAAFAACNLSLGAVAAADYAAAGVASAVFHTATAARALSAALARKAERAAQCDLLREIFGNPFRPVTIDHRWLRWNDGTVEKLAQAISDSSHFGDLPILADALEDAGCDSEAVLSHCRRGGEHVRGCWVLDLLLGKEQP